MKRLLRKLLLATMALFAAAAGAHEMSMAEMQIREVTRGEFLWQWTASSDRKSGVDLTPVWPDACAAEGNLLRCGAAGLQGKLVMEGVGQRYSAAMVKVQWLDGQSRVYTLTGSQPAVQLYGAADDARGVGEIASAYLLLGVEHILSGYDHLLVVIGLLFLVGFQRRLVSTITAFTVAHSLTLTSAAGGWLTLRSPPVEACIALSIVLVASEALSSRDTLARRWPALAGAGGFRFRPGSRPGICRPAAHRGRRMVAGAGLAQTTLGAAAAQPGAVWHRHAGGWLDLAARGRHLRRLKKKAGPVEGRLGVPRCQVKVLVAPRSRWSAVWSG